MTTSITSLPSASLPLTGGERVPLDQTVGSPVAAASLSVGTGYRIETVGSTNWTACGLPAGVTAAVGLTFVATAAGTGTGTAIEVETRESTTGAIAALAPGTNLAYDPATRLLSSSTGTDVTLSLATDTLPGLMAAGDKARIDQLGADDSPSFTGLTITGTAAVTIPHIHGDLAGAVYIHVKNTTANTLAKGSPVYPAGTVGDTTTLEVAGADSSNPNLLPAVGLLADALAPNASGHAVIAGELTGLNTAGYAIGDALYVASGGGLTATRPTTGTIQQVAIVGRVNSGTGSATVTISTEISPNWDTAYSQRLRWDGGATGLNAATGRASLELGTLATQSGTFSGTSSGTNTGDVTLAASVADVLSLAGQQLQADDPGDDRLLFLDHSEGRLRHLELGSNLSITGTTLNAAGGGGGISDGDKGDIMVSSGGTAWTIDNGAVTYAKIQNVSATDRILGRSSAGAGPVEEIICTAAARALLDDANAAAQRETIGAEQAGAAAAAQAAAVQRNNHTGTQLASTISDFSAAVAALGTTVGNALRSLVNPSAVAFLRINADNSVTARSASEMRGDLELTSAATATIGTAAGNLVALDGSARLPAVDGSQLTNLPSAGAPFAYRAGAYIPTSLAPFVTSPVIAINTIFFYPFTVRRAVRISGTQNRVNTGQAGTFQIAIYAASSANVPTGNPLCTTGDLSMAVGTLITSSLTPASVWLYPNQIYFRAVNVTGQATGTFTAPSPAVPEFASLVGMTTNGLPSGTIANIEFSLSWTYGTWPDMSARTVTESNNPRMFVALLVSELN